MQMINAEVLIKISKQPLKVMFKIALIYGWPILLNGAGYLLMWNSIISRFQAFFIPLLSLLLATILSRLKTGKSLCVVASMIYCFIKAAWLIEKTLSILKSHDLLAVWMYNWHFYTVLLGYFIIIVMATQHLWVEKKYQEIFKVHKIILDTNLQKNGLLSWIFWHTNKLKIWIINPVVALLNLAWSHKNKVFPFWFIPIMYYCWFKPYRFLAPNQNQFHFLGYLQLWLVPFGILLVSFIAHKPFSLMRRTGVMLATSSCMFPGLYGLYQYGIYYKNHWILTLDKKHPKIMLLQLQGFFNNLNAWVWAIDFIGLSVGVCIFIKLSRSLTKPELKQELLGESNNYGTSRFLDRKGIKKINQSKGIIIGAMPKNITFKNTKSIIENIRKNGGNELIRINASHTTLIAPSRTGKGVGVIIPALLEYPGPVFVTDVKGENYHIVKRARALKNNKVVAFDPFGITESPKIKINPLKFLDPNSTNVVDDAQTLANLICPISPRDGTNAHHFQSQAAAVIQCLLLYVVCNQTLDQNNKTLSYIYDLLCLPSEELNELLKIISSETNMAFGSVARLANSILGTHPEERSGIFSSARVEIRFIDTYQVREATSDSDFLLSDITKGNTDLFVCIPLEKLSTQHRLLRLLTGIVFIEMQKARGKIGNHNLLMVLDEMPALGHMKQIEEMLVYGGGFGISLLVVSQTIEFLQSVYPYTWKTFFSNQLSIFFGCSDPMTSRFVAEKLGKETIRVESSNESFGNQKRGAEFTPTTSLQSSQSISETGRDLLMPDEIERLGERVVLAFDRGQFPIMCHRIDYRERTEWTGLWDENPLHINREKHSSISLSEYFKQVFNILIN